MDRGQVQADEIGVTVCQGRIGQAPALVVPSRLWLGRALRPTRDGALVTATLRWVAACAASTALLIGGDGFSAYVEAAPTVVRVVGRPGQPGRLRGAAGDRAAGPGGHDHQGGDVTRRVVCGTAEAILVASARTKGAGRDADQYLVQRATPRHLPRRAGVPDPLRAAPGPRRQPR